MMVVYKFGGASVKDAWGIRNLADIASKEKENLVIVISAFGKTTNALENVLKKWMSGDKSYADLLKQTVSYHSDVLGELIPGKSDTSLQFENQVHELTGYLENTNPGEYDFEYDQIVSYGELWSTIIVAGYLNAAGIPAKWVDIRKLLLTDSRHKIGRASCRERV